MDRAVRGFPLSCLQSKVTKKMDHNYANRARVAGKRNDPVHPVHPDFGERMCLPAWARTDSPAPADLPVAPAGEPVDDCDWSQFWNRLPMRHKAWSFRKLSYKKQADLRQQLKQSFDNLQPLIGITHPPRYC